MHIIYTYAFVLAALAALAPVTYAQRAPLSPARVTLVAGDGLSRKGRTEVVRRAHRAPQNLVIVDRNASAEDLVAALTMIQALRQQYGDNLSADFRARPEVVRAGPTWQKSAYRGWLIAQLVRLRTATPAIFADLGIVKAVHITLPAARGTITTPANTR